MLRFEETNSISFYNRLIFQGLNTIEDAVSRAQDQTWVQANITALSQVTSLNLIGYSLSILSPEIVNLVALQGLKLNGSRLRALPSEIGKLTSLQFLDLSGNPLESLLPELGNLDQLQVIILPKERRKL